MSQKRPKISRVTRSKAQAKASYNRMSRWYDIVTGSSEGKYRDIGLNTLKAQEGEKILEIGFGTGHAIVSLAKSVGPSGKIYGIDISEGMYDLALARVQRAGLNERVKLSVGDALNLPFEPNFFDAIFMSFTLELFDTPEMPVLLKECLRVLREKGRICVVALAKKIPLL